MSSAALNALLLGTGAGPGNPCAMFQRWLPLHKFDEHKALFMRRDLCHSGGEPDR